MIRPLRRQTRRTPTADPEINRALEAMSAPELRAAVHAVLDGLDADVKFTHRYAHRPCEEVLAVDARACVANTSRACTPRRRFAIERTRCFGPSNSWCDALAERGDWAAALRACDAAAALVGRSHWRGNLLDGAAVATQQLGRPDRSKRLEAAWRAAPTLTRLLRWLVADGHSSATVRRKANKALALCPRKAGRQIGLLQVLLGDVAAAAALLSKAPGLRWSDPEHPGHAVFPLLALLLSDGTNGKVSDALVPELEATGCDPLEVFSDEDTESKPKLSTCSITRLIHALRPSITLTHADRAAATEARVTAEKRVEEILGNSRRRHYGHAALLVASCVASAPAGRERELAKWAADVRQQYWRRHAFREELTRAYARLGLAPLS